MGYIIVAGFIANLGSGHIGIDEELTGMGNPDLIQKM